MTHHDTCPICESKEIPLFITCSDNLVSGGEFNLHRCKNCNFLFTNDHPSEAESARYYESDDYISHTDSRKSFMDNAYHFVRSFMLRKKRRMVVSATGLTEGSILDIGSGTGYFLAEMKRSGWDISGIEISSKARDFSNRKLGVDSKTPDSIYEMKNDSFDCITLWHVLEHFHDPFAYMKEIRRLLKPEGILVVALPNSESFDSTYYGRYWAAYDVPRHLWHFDPDTFESFGQKTGFKTRYIKRLPFDVFYISILSEKYKGKKFTIIAGMVLGLIFWAGSMFRKYKCSSLVYILQAE